MQKMLRRLVKPKSKVTGRLLIKSNFVSIKKNAVILVFCCCKNADDCHSLKNDSASENLIMSRLIAMALLNLVL